MQSLPFAVFWSVSGLYLGVVFSDQLIRVPLRYREALQWTLITLLCLLVAMHVLGVPTG